MKDPLYVKTRIENLMAQLVPQDFEYRYPHDARIQILMWIYNMNKMKTQKEIEAKLERCKEEIIAFDFMNDYSIQRKAVENQIFEIENILSDD